MPGVGARLREFEEKQAFLDRTLRFVRFGDVVSDIGGAERRTALVDQRNEEFLEPDFAAIGQLAFDNAWLRTRAGGRRQFGRGLCGQPPFAAEMDQLAFTEEIECPLACAHQLPVIVIQHHGVAFGSIHQHIERALFARSCHCQTVFHLVESMLELFELVVRVRLQRDPFDGGYAVDPRYQSRHARGDGTVEDCREYQTQRQRSGERDKDHSLGERPGPRAQRFFGQNGQHHPFGCTQCPGRDIGIEIVGKERAFVDAALHIGPDFAEQRFSGCRQIDIGLEFGAVHLGRARMMDQLAIGADDNGEGVFGRRRQAVGQQVERNADAPGAKMPPLYADGQHAPSGPAVAAVVIERSLQAGAAELALGILLGRGDAAELGVLEIEIRRRGAVEHQFVGAARRVDQQIVRRRKEIQALDLAGQAVGHLPKRLEGGEDCRTPFAGRLRRRQISADPGEADGTRGPFPAPQFVARMGGTACCRNEDLVERCRPRAIELGGHRGHRFLLGFGDKRNAAFECPGGRVIGDTDFAHRFGAIFVDAPAVNAPRHRTNDQCDDRQRNEQASERQ